MFSPSFRSSLCLLLRASRTAGKRTFSTTKNKMGGGFEGVTYRGPQGAQAPDVRRLDMMATFGMTCTYWWIFWHLFTEPEHLFGEYPYPKPSEWTDQELGIPPDEEG